MDAKPNDGLIFQPLTAYRKGNIWKWKPSDQLTVDFYLRFEQDAMTVYLMENNEWVVSHDFRIEGTLPNENIDSKVVECKYSREGDCWKPLRIRRDKSFPNTVKIARQNLDMIRNEIKFEDIVDEISQVGFAIQE